ncbi:hypothetical protein KI387_043384, partial [Taxus chinensis]
MEEFHSQYIGLRVASFLKSSTTEAYWAFNMTGALEGVNFLITGKLLSLSEKKLVEDHKCDPSKQRDCDSGYNGGLMTSEYEYAIKYGGLESEKYYPCIWEEEILA